MSTRLTEALSDRTIAAAPVCLEVGPRDEASRGVPIVTIFGERDGKQMERLFAKLPAERAAGAQWAIAVQWRRKHEFGQANNLAMPWFDRVIGYRLPTSPGSGPPELKSIEADSGYIGSVSRWDQPVAEVVSAKSFEGNLDQTVWLPDAYLARTWQAFVTPLDSPLRISQPVGMGDGARFETHAAGKPIAVNLRIASGAEFEELKLYHGDQELLSLPGSATTASIDGLPPGIYPLIVRGIRQGKVAALSRPNTIIVK